MELALNPALSLLQSSHEGYLATLEMAEDVKEFKPFASAVGLFFQESAEERFGNLYMLLSQLARHSQNLNRHPYASVLVIDSQSKEPIQERKRLSVQGQVRLAPNAMFEKLKNKYLEIFPRAKIFFTLADFKFYQLAIEELYWIGGFGKATQFK